MALSSAAYNSSICKPVSQLLTTTEYCPVRAFCIPHHALFQCPNKTIRLRNGPVLYFGTVQRLTAKWAAIARVLADPDAAGATYLDATVPERVAAGGLEPTATLNP